MELAQDISQNIASWQLPGVKIKEVVGGEYSTVCPDCSRDQLRIWPDEGKYGKFWCRRCGKSGDFLSWREPEPMTLIPGVDYFPMEAWELPILNQKPSLDCVTCESNKLGWCLIHPRNQFVNVRFIEHCPKDCGSCSTCKLDDECEKEKYSWMAYADRCQGYIQGAAA